MNRTKICIVGACGKLGSSIIQESIKNFEIVGAVEAVNSPNIGKSLINLGIVEFIFS